MILRLLEEAQAAGSRLAPACRALGLSARTIQRFRARVGGEDRRQGPQREPANKLSNKERHKVLECLTSPENRDLSPNQVVPRLADEGKYLASESTMYRILRQENLLRHRERSHPAVHNKPKGYVATGPNQVWSWDITYLCSSVRGQFYYLYLLEDIWSRKIMAAKVHTEESSVHAASLIESACKRHRVNPSGLVLHSDNGGPMKGSTMLATLHRMGVVPSFSRPRVSDDNPFSEALFRTLKYRPEYPDQPFDSLEQAQTWVDGFLLWYNREHKHSAIRFVTPEERHDGRELQILQHRAKLYEAARKANPNRWSRSTRNWKQIAEVNLNVRSSDHKTAAEHRSAA